MLSANFIFSLFFAKIKFKSYYLTKSVKIWLTKLDYSNPNQKSFAAETVLLKLG